MIERANLVLVLLQNCQTLTREMRLAPEQAWVPHAVEFMLAVLEPLPVDPRQDAVVRRRAADYLADVCEAALDLARCSPGAAARSIRIKARTSARARSMC